MSADSGVKLRARSKDEDELRELDSVDANRGFSELRETTFVGPPAPECRLFIDDEPLDSLADSVNEWSWKPGFYAGEVRAELLDRDDHSLGVWRLDVSPDPDKTGRELFARMLHEIAAFDAHLVVGEEPARWRLGALGETDDPLVLFERLRRWRRDLERSLAAIRPGTRERAAGAPPVRPAPGRSAHGSPHPPLGRPATCGPGSHRTGHGVAVAVAGRPGS